MATGALPTAPTMIGTDPDAQKEYFDALNQALKALEGRQETNWWNVAAGFAKPTRSGSFGESLGNVAETLGKQQEEQEARAPAIAQMRAALAGQKFQVTKQTNALNALGQAIGSKGTDPIQTLSQMNPYDPGLMQRLSNVYPIVAQDKDTAGIVDKMFDQNVKMQDLIVKQRQAGASDAELLMKYGNAIKPLLIGQTTAPVIAPSQKTGVPGGPVSAPRPQVIDPNAAVVGTPTQTSGTTADDLAERNEFGVSTQNPAANLPPAAQIELNQKQIIARQDDDRKQWEPARKAIFEYTPQTYNTSKDDMAELLMLAKRSPEALGVLKQNPGFLQTALNLADQGISIGKFGSIAIPLDKTILAGLDTDKQADAARMAQILARQFFLSAKADKASIPGSVSNYEEKLLQAPLASMADLPKVVEGYARRQLVLNEQRRELYNSLHAYDKKLPIGGLYGPYFSNDNPVYNEINERYSKFYQQLGAPR